MKSDQSATKLKAIFLKNQQKTCHKNSGEVLFLSTI